VSITATTPSAFAQSRPPSMYDDKTGGKKSALMKGT